MKIKNIWNHHLVNFGRSSAITYTTPSTGLPHWIRLSVELTADPRVERGTNWILSSADFGHQTPITWRIIPVSNWLVTPIYKPWKAHLEGEYPYLGDLLTMVINHLLNGMILQAVCKTNMNHEEKFGLTFLLHIPGEFTGFLNHQ